MAPASASGRTQGPASAARPGRLTARPCCSPTAAGNLETTSGTKPLQPRTALYGYNNDQSGGPDGGHTILSGYNPSWTPGQIAFTAGTSDDDSGLNFNGDMCDMPTPDAGNEACIEVYSTSTKDFSYPVLSNGDPLTASCDIDSGNYGQTYLAIDWARWSPNGENLIYEYQVENAQSASCSPPPSSAWFVGSLVGGSYAPATQVGDQQADYSPDGKYIVLANALPGQTANVIIESNTGANRKTLAQGYEPDWQPIPGARVGERS